MEFTFREKAPEEKVLVVDAAAGRATGTPFSIIVYSCSIFIFRRLSLFLGCIVCKCNKSSVCDEIGTNTALTQDRGLYRSPHLLALDIAPNGCGLGT